MTETEHSHEVKVPVGALIGAGALLLFTMALVGWFRISGLDPTARVPEPDQGVEVRQLRFEDSTEGTVSVFEIQDGSPEQLVHVIQPGEGGFIRGVLRSMARSRRASGIGSEHPFLLIQQADGSILLEDPETRQRIYLPAFGPSNIDAFRELLSNTTRPDDA